MIASKQDGGQEVDVPFSEDFEKLIPEMAKLLLDGPTEIAKLLLDGPSTLQFTELYRTLYAFFKCWNVTDWADIGVFTANDVVTTIQSSTSDFGPLKSPIMLERLGYLVDYCHYDGCRMTSKTTLSEIIAYVALAKKAEEWRTAKDSEEWGRSIKDLDFSFEVPDATTVPAQAKDCGMKRSRSLNANLNVLSSSNEGIRQLTRSISLDNEDLRCDMTGSVAEALKHEEPQQETDKTRRKREAYLWWKRLGSPSKKVLIRKCGMEDIYLNPEDVELLPWLPGELYVDVRRIMNWVDAIEALEPPKRGKKKNAIGVVDTNDPMAPQEREKEKDEDGDSDAESVDADEKYVQNDIAKDIKNDKRKDEGKQKEKEKENEKKVKKHKRKDAVKQAEKKEKIGTKNVSNNKKTKKDGKEKEGYAGLEKELEIINKKKEKAEKSKRTDCKTKEEENNKRGGTKSITRDDSSKKLTCRSNGSKNSKEKKKDKDKKQKKGRASRSISPRRGFDWNQGMWDTRLGRSEPCLNFNDLPENDDLDKTLSRKKDKIDSNSLRRNRSIGALPGSFERSKTWSAADIEKLDWSKSTKLSELKGNKESTKNYKWTLRGQASTSKRNIKSLASKLKIQEEKQMKVNRTNSTNLLEFDDNKKSPKNGKNTSRGRTLKRNRKSPASKTKKRDENAIGTAVYPATSAGDSLMSSSSPSKSVKSNSKHNSSKNKCKGIKESTLDAKESAQQTTDAIPPVLSKREKYKALLTSSKNITKGEVETFTAGECTSQIISVVKQAKEIKKSEFSEIDLNFLSTIDVDDEESSVVSGFSTIEDYEWRGATEADDASDCSSGISCGSGIDDDVDNDKMWKSITAHAGESLDGWNSCSKINEHVFAQ